MSGVHSSDEASRTLHDRLFKEFLQRFLPSFLRAFLPREAAQLNFDTLEFRKQELIVNFPQQMLRITDTVAEVRTLAGEPEVIIVHVEVEARYKEQLAQRMFEYYSLLSLMEDKPVLPVAIVLKRAVTKVAWQG